MRMAALFLLAAHQNHYDNLIPNIPDFLAIVGRQLNGSGVLKGLGIHWPKSQGDPDMAVTGQLAAKLRATEISWDAVIVPAGAAADAAALQAWWINNGLVLVERWEKALKRDEGATHDTVKTGKALSQGELDQVLGSNIYDQAYGLVMELDDYDGALALMNGPGPVPLLMSRAVARYSDKIPKAPSDQHKERAF